MMNVLSTIVFGIILAVTAIFALLIVYTIIVEIINTVKKKDYSLLFALLTGVAVLIIAILAILIIKWLKLIYKKYYEKTPHLLAFQEDILLIVA